MPADLTPPTSRRPTRPAPPACLIRRPARVAAWLKGLVLALLCVGGVHAPVALAATTIKTGDGSGPRIEGSGRVGEEVRTTAPFSALTLTGPVDVQLKAGAAPRVTVRADDNLLPVITTEVVDRRLVVGIKPQTWARTRNKMVVVVESVMSQYCGWQSRAGVVRYLKFREPYTVEPSACRHANKTGMIVINKKIQTDLGVGCWVSLSLRIERFSLTYLFAQPNLRNY